MKLFTKTEIETHLNQLDLSWHFDGENLFKAFVFLDFDQAVLAFNLISEIAKKQCHHPKMTNEYNKLIVKIHTHDIGGISQKDFDLIQAIELLDL